MDSIIALILLALSIVCLYPMWYVIVASFTDATELASNPGVLLWPEKFEWGAYKLVFKNPMLTTSFFYSIFILNTEPYHINTHISR